MPRSNPRKPRSLTLWMAMSVGVFVLVCSFALLLVFGTQVAREESAEFEALAKANAAFLNRTPLPHSEKMAAQLGEVMGAEVVFDQNGQLIGKPGGKLDADLHVQPTDGTTHWLTDQRMVVGHELKRSSKVYFVRRTNEGGKSPSLAMLDRGNTWVVLGIVWLLSSALAWWLARRVARPLQSLAKAVEEVGGDGPLPHLPVDRNDEIGQLARALAEAHTSLVDERERRRSAERLALLGRMATGLAHEVRNPVAAIRMHAQLLDGAPADEAATSAKLIESEAARIEILVTQWMRYARPAPPVMAEVNLRELIHQVAQALEPQARHAAVSITIDDQTQGNASMQGDGARLQQALMNLLLNAIQAMPGGGSLKVSLQAQEKSLQVIVADEGKGFSAMALEKLGEPFFSEKEGGMGLGLAMAKEVCNAHGGELRATNRQGRGACVVIQLPLSPPPPHS